MPGVVAKLLSAAVALCVVVFSLKLAAALLSEAAVMLHALAEIAPTIAVLAAVFWAARKAFQTVKRHSQQGRADGEAAPSGGRLEGGLPFAPPYRDRSHAASQTLVYAVAALVLLGIPAATGWGIYTTLKHEKRLREYEDNRLQAERAAQVMSRCIGKKLEEARLRDWRERQKAEAEGRPVPTHSEERLLRIMWDAGPKWCPDGWQTLVQEGE